ncbi:MAG TPA: glycoside hydrolase family 3 C-terminal domain-containing protein, partial [Trueperaceae bacterium]|nr:glycoside hydrolase family 3 C-terminal domain-containing protein [Trueperaceae bacterium]
DYMDMDAIKRHFGAGEAAVMSVLAGADLVLLGPDLETQREVHAALLAAMRDGTLSEERVREAAGRSLAVAQAYPPQLDAEAPPYAAHRELARQVAEAGATLLWNDDVLPLAAAADVLVIAPQPGGFGEPPHLGDVLARSLPGVRSLAVATNPTEEQIATALAQAQTADVVVLATYHWLGAFPAGMARLADSLGATGTPLVVVAIGNPDDVRFLSVRPAAFLAVYGYREANLQGAAAVLTGAITARGVLPVPIEGVPAAPR